MSQQEQQMEASLDRLYNSDRQGGLSTSRPVTPKWFGEIKSLFPQNVVRIIQRDALDRFGIKKLLSQPSFLDSVEPDASMVATILTVKDALPPEALSATRALIKKLARRIEHKLKFKLISKIGGVKDLQKTIKNPKHQQIDWHLTIRQNLKHYQPNLGTIIPHQIIGRPNRKNQAKKLILLVDQSASMSESFVYAGILGSIMSSISSIDTRLVIFDTEVVDLSDHLADPVELLMQAQLGGGTNIGKALGYASQLVGNKPKETFIVLITDLFEGGPLSLLMDQVHLLLNQEVNIITLLALDDQGKPTYDKEVSKLFCSLGIPSFACSPDKFPDLMAAALNQEDISRFS